MKLNAPADHQQFVIEGREFTVDENGQVEADDDATIAVLRAHGCTAEGEAVARVEPNSPPPVPEGMVSEDAVRALIVENEQLVSDLQAANSRAGGLETELVAAKARIDELDKLLADTTEGRDAALQRLADAGATETGTGAQAGAEGGAGTADAEEVEEDTTEAAGAIKEVDGILVKTAEAFDEAEYNFLKKWLHEHGIGASANIKKVEAIAACKARFAELTAPAAE